MKQMRTNWNAEEWLPIGATWFEDRKSHTDSNNDLFVGIQEQGSLPVLPEADQLVVYYSSSGDEIAEIGLDWTQYLGSQENALRVLAEECRKRPNTKLIVRTHPHMRLKPASDLRDWIQAVDLASPDLHIDPYSSVDSYALMERADLVFTYGSTAGVEAGYFGRPVVVMGPSAYDELGFAKRVNSASEISDCLDNPPKSNSEGATLYGLMMQRRGFNFSQIKSVPGDALMLREIRIEEASEKTRRASDLHLKMLKRWLISR
jgi:hypothetical protein